MLLNYSDQIVLASSNLGKIKEIQNILSGHTIVTQKSLNITEVEETGSTFIENAILKAKNATLHSKLPAIADDSGLVIDALQGAPGIISARYAGEDATDLDNLNLVLQNMASVPDAERTARFICVIVLMRHAKDPFPLIAQASWEGKILTSAQGSNGFGYDPIFWLEKENCSSAELSPAKKNQLSHRAQALQQLEKHLLSHNL
ncbi:MAG: RdgB/HAM1 family non-canonical purine NTP pyrophosphatase [Methyloprofundus sp.]|nr:RdgB/HAM1 family non-canonical purine NTP pyrophosphatase [Methyloprofundus sp.]